MQVGLAPVEVVHDAVPGRARFRVPSLDPHAAEHVEAALRELDGVRSVHVRARSRSVLVFFDTPAATRVLVDRLRELITEEEPSGEHRRRARAALALPPVESLGRAFSAAARAARAIVASAPPLGARRPARMARLRAEAIRPSRPWHALRADEVLAEIEVDGAHGLTADEVARRRERHGPNLLAPVDRRGELEIFVHQLRSLPVAMLAVSAALSLATGGVADAIAILTVMTLNAGIGYFTESSAEKTLGSLEQAVPRTTVALRGGEPVEIPVEDVVPGDVLVLTPGQSVPADARVLATRALTIDESALTGESAPAEKTTAPLDGATAALADRTNMVFRGTVVTGGSGVVVVVAIGQTTQIGLVQQIAGELTTRETPLQRQLARLSTQLVVASGIACGGVFLVALARGHRLMSIVRTSISLAVAAIPEGLPTVAVTTLALGVTRMRRRQVAIRHLSAIETLGAVSVLCLDKTGTITENQMTVVSIAVGDRPLDEVAAVTDDGSRHTSELPALAALLRVAVLCNEVQLVEDDGERRIVGTPTEAALVRAALSAGVDVGAVRAAHPLHRTEYRSERRGFMDTLHAAPGGESLVAVKGRPSEVLALCKRRQDDQGIHPLDEHARAAVLRTNAAMASRGQRVLGFAYGEDGSAEVAAGELVWLGLAGMTDPPRNGVGDVLRRFRSAGISARMITGDQRETALAVAREVGVGSSDGDVEVLDSAPFDELEAEQVRDVSARTHVFARVSPSQKLTLVRALQANGLVVAMTGDGINDGPALKAADVGVAMGRSGTTAAREVADVVLLDDDLSSMLAAVEEGRTVYLDIRKAVRFAVSTNMSELLLTFGAVAAGVGQPLTSMQLLWINLLTDVLPEIALAVEPAEHDVMSRPPRDAGQGMFSRADLLAIGGEGLLVTAGAAAAYSLSLSRHGPGPRACSVAFTTLTTAQLLHAISSRSEAHSVFHRERLARNPLMGPTLLGSFALQAAAIFVPGMRTLLGTARLAPRELVLSVACGLAPFLVDELRKLLRSTSLRT